MGKALTKTRLITIIVAGIIIALLAAVAIFFGVVHAKYKGVALPNTYLASNNVSGMTEAQIVSLQQKAVDDKNIELTVKDKKSKASLAELGIKMRAEENAKAALSRPSTFSYFTSFFKDRKIKPAYDLDKDKTREYLKKLIPAKIASGTPAKVNVNLENGEVTVSDSVNGLSPDTVKFFSRIEEIAKNPQPASVVVELKSEPPKFDSEQAKAVAKEIKERRDLTVELKAGKQVFKPGDKERFSFINVSTGDDGTQSIAVNNDAVNKWVNTVIAKFSEKPVDGIKRVYENGELAQMVQESRDGSTVKNAEALRNQVDKAYAGNSKFSGTLQIEKVKAKETKKIVAKNSGSLAYAPLKDEKWFDVNLSNHTATAYVGSKIVHGPIAMVNGSRNHKTVVGTYKVWAKVRSQTMRGPGYAIPNVEWILYFHGDYALHGAPWWKDFGFGGESRGSHGCINLPVPAAKWFYQWADVGTVVVTHY